MQAVTDGLWQLFNSQHTFAEVIRNRGMAMLNRVPLIKSILMQPAIR
jgi:2-polyprenyl-6-methoxyphenol hydroxylase-like FAD-dependent oxidoreductase